MCSHRGHALGISPILSGATVVLAEHFRHSKHTPLISSIPTINLRFIVILGNPRLWLGCWNEAFALDDEFALNALIVNEPSVSGRDGKANQTSDRHIKVQFLPAYFSRNDIDTGDEVYLMDAFAEDHPVHNIRRCRYLDVHFCREWMECSVVLRLNRDYRSLLPVATDGLVLRKQRSVE